MADNLLLALASVIGGARDVLLPYFQGEQKASLERELHKDRLSEEYSQKKRYSTEVEQPFELEKKKLELGKQGKEKGFEYASGLRKEFIDRPEVKEYQL